MERAWDCFSSFNGRRIRQRRPAIGLAVAACMLSIESAAEPLTEWHLRDSGTNITFEGVTYGSGLFVAVGEYGTIVSSPDGVTWTRETSHATGTLQDVVYANGIFVAAGRGPTLLTSPDGHNWTKRDWDQGSGPVSLIHDGTRFVMLKAGASVSVSTNGIDWTQKGAVGAKYDAAGIAFGNNTYVEVGYKRTGQPPDVYSAPSFEGPWEKRDGKVGENLMGVAFAKGKFIAVGQSGVLATSPDGIEWTPRESQTTGFIWNLAEGGPYVVASSQWGRLLVSEDGINWTRMETEVFGHLKDVVYGKGTFVAVGWDGAIVQSNVIEPATEEEQIVILRPRWSTQSFTCEFTGKVGDRYTLQGSLDGIYWHDRENVICTSENMTVTDSFADGEHCLYRLVKK